MGQQQLLLLVLGIVIVGLAVVTGLQAFGVNQKKSNADALVLTGTRIASDLQAWLRTPSALGGGLPATGVPPAVTSHNVRMQDLGYPVNGAGLYETVNGTFLLTKSSDAIIVLALSKALGADGDNNRVIIEVKGPALSDITTTVGTIPGSP